jgi:hypothetical protein
VYLADSQTATAATIPAPCSVKHFKASPPAGS